MRSAIFEYTRKLLLALLLLTFSNQQWRAQVDAFFSYGTFNTPSNQAFVETYITVLGKSLKAKAIDTKLQHAVIFSIKIKKDTLLVKSDKYRLLGPLFTDSSQAPSFIDNQRYSLDNGNYTIELTLNDANDSLKKPLTIKSNFSIYFNSNELQSSSIQALEHFKKATSDSKLNKSGFELIPYPVNYYPESSKFLTFYFESYHANKILGEASPFIYRYYLETADNHTPLNSYGSFKKEKSAAVNPLLAKIDISKLGSGNYNLVIEIINAENKTLHIKKYNFDRHNNMVDVVSLQNFSEKQNLAQYVGRCNNADTLKIFVECLWPIADNYDKDRIINQAINKNPDMMKNFIVDFWQRRAADTANPLKLWSAYYREVQQVLANFKCGKQQGYYTDRGRVYLQYGPPNQRSIQLMENNTFPYEIWQYYKLVDGVNGQSFTNRKFVFVNKQIGDDCFKLIHSDMRGEINNPRWQFEVTRRNNNGLGNPDNTTPAGTEFNQFDEIYSSPR